jgi:uncharacterized membrane protein YfcA
VSEPVSTLAVLVALAALAGIFGGLLAGLLGVGGGIVIVPLIELAFAGAGVDASQTMHLAVATSMATIVPTSIASSRAPARRGAVDHATVRRWSAFIAVGALVGAVVATRLGGRVLAALFAVLALAVAARMLIGRDALRADAPPVAPAANPALPFGIGILSALLGIGGGTLSVPVLTARGLSIHEAVGTAARLGLAISVPATIGYLVLPAERELMPPWTVGYVNLPAFALVSTLTWFAAPWGARLAHRASRTLLSRAFAVFLLAVAVRMILRIVAA